MAQSTSQKTIIQEALKREFTTETGRPKNYTIKIKNGPTYTGNNLSGGGVSITESLSSNNSFDLAAVEKPTIEFTLLNLERNIGLLKGKEVELAITVGSMAMPAGTYIIDNAEKQNDHLYNIKASGMLAKFNQDVSAWWNKEVQFPITHRNLLISLCNKVGIDYQLPQTYTNSNAVIAQRNMYVNEATGATFLGYLQEMAGCFFVTSRLLDNGKTLTIKKITQPTGTPGMVYTGSHYIGTVEIADYNIKKIDVLQIRATKDDIGVLAGNKDGKNPYLIEGNPLLYGMASADLQPIATAIFNELKDVQYIPFTASMMGVPYIEPGDTIQFNTPAGATIKTLLMKRTFAGTQFFKDALETKAKEQRENQSKPARTITILNQKLHEFETSIEKFKSKIANISTEVGNANKGTRQYYLQTASKDTPSKNDSAWSTTKPPSIAGQHMWYMLADITANDNEVRHEPLELTGIKGDTGRGIVGTPEITYQAGSSATTPPTGEWLANIPLVNEGYTLWIRAVYKYSDDTTSEVFSPSIAGKTGRGVKQVTPEYYLSTSKTELTGGTWNAAQPEKTNDTWVWIRYKTTFTDETVGYSDATKDDVLNGLVELTTTNKSTIEQLNGSITHLVNQTTENRKGVDSVKTELQTLQQQTADGFSRTIQRSEFDKTVDTIAEKLDENGLHIGSDKEDTVTTVDTNGVNVKKSDGTLLAKFDKVDSMLAYLRVLEYLSAGAHRIEAKTTVAEITEFTGGKIKTAEVKASVINWIGDIKTYGNA
jgi:hypothetical protein